MSSPMRDANDAMCVFEVCLNLCLGCLQFPLSSIRIFNNIETFIPIKIMYM